MPLLGLLGPLGIWEILLILVVVIFMFGARRIPEIARGLGEGIRDFRTALRGDTGATGPRSEDPPTPPSPQNQNKTQG